MSSDCCTIINMTSIRSVVVGVFKLPKRCLSLEFRIIRIDFQQGFIYYTQVAQNNLRIVGITSIA
jgi:hypothetical protein